ncbi:MAG: 7-cyano-7-deazaguanine synthase QueC [Spirochaetes bacterium]|nr:7-cyano-7-deazaguanine synthase QueC [Spirochaetota bacterium]
MKRAIVLLSGGIDSTTTLAIAQKEGYQIIALTFRYGQRHGKEIECAQKICRAMNVLSHIKIEIPARLFMGSALAGEKKLEVPKSGNVSAHEIPVTYVPARNLLFLAYGIVCAESYGAYAVFIGANALDYSGYPDCRPEFLKAFEEAARCGTKCGVEGKPIRVISPLLNKTKAEIIRLGISLGVDYSMTHSCYDPDEYGRACGRCESCVIRKRGFRDAGIEDPTQYIDDVQ